GDGSSRVYTLENDGLFAYTYAFDGNQNPTSRVRSSVATFAGQSLVALGLIDADRAVVGTDQGVHVQLTRGGIAEALPQPTSALSLDANAELVVVVDGSKRLHILDVDSVEVQ